MERATQERLVGATLLILAGVITIPWLLDGNSAGPALTERELVLPGGNESGNETRRILLEVPPADSGSNDNSVREIDARTVRDIDQPAAMNLPTPKPVAISAKPVTETVAEPGTVPTRFAKPMPESTSTSSQAAAKPAPAPVRNEVASLPVPQVQSSSQQTATRKPAAAAPKPVIQPTPTRTETKPVVQASTASVSKAWAVQVGSFASQENAERLAELLRGKSYKAFVMRNVIEGRVRYRVRVGPVNERSQADLLATALREDRQPARVLAHP